MNARIKNIDGFLSRNRSEAKALIQDLGLTIEDIKYIGDVSRNKKEDDYGRAESHS